MKLASAFATFSAVNTRRRHDGGRGDEKVSAALANNTVLSLKDTEGKVVIVPSEAIGYVESTTPRRAARLRLTLRSTARSSVA